MGPNLTLLHSLTPRYTHLHFDTIAHTCTPTFGLSLEGGGVHTVIL